MALFLLRPGELMLKKGSRPLFERKLRTNLKNRLADHLQKFENKHGRYYLTVGDDSIARTQQVLATTFGLAAYHQALTAPVSQSAIEQVALTAVAELAALPALATFKVEVRRSNKSFPMSSYDIAAHLGHLILTAHPHLSVTMNSPSFTLYVEIRERAYLYSEVSSYARGAGGLPSATAGRGLLLLSGGIDSPVAGWLMAKRGLTLIAAHFHTPPYTSPAALQKVHDLAQKLAPWNGGRIVLHTVNFTPLQLAINAIVPPSFVTIISRICMTRIAHLLGVAEHAPVLITGEALAQVASQTLESLICTDAMAQTLVLRPCVGMDKQQIIRIARQIETFAISNLPGDDCCSLFAPTSPKIHPLLGEVQALFEAGNFETLIQEAVASSDRSVKEEASTL